MAVVVFEDRRPSSKQQAGGMAARRDAWLARSVSDAIVVHDREDERTEKVLASLVVQLGDEHVLQLHP
jgi:hypothetical protein